jgi:hypothetical protein
MKEVIQIACEWGWPLALKSGINRVQSDQMMQA